jgi:hypothetical protein
VVAVGPDVELTDYYEQNANAFIATTRDFDMSDARGRFLAVMPLRQRSTARILDAGSGFGRILVIRRSYMRLGSVLRKRPFNPRSNAELLHCQPVSVVC